MKRIRQQLTVIINKHCSYLLVLCIIISSCSKRHQYTVIRNNYHDTVYIKADTFKVSIINKSAYFIKDNIVINKIDSINRIK